MEQTKKGVRVDKKEEKERKKEEGKERIGEETNRREKKNKKKKGFSLLSRIYGNQAVGFRRSKR